MPGLENVSTMLLIASTVVFVVPFIAVVIIGLKDDLPGQE